MTGGYKCKQNKKKRKRLVFFTRKDSNLACMVFGKAIYHLRLGHKEVGWHSILGTSNNLRWNTHNELLRYYLLLESIPQIVSPSMLYSYARSGQRRSNDGKKQKKGRRGALVTRLVRIELDIFV